MIFRRIVGLLLLLLTVIAYVVAGTDPAPDLVATFYFVGGLWLAWALVVVFLIRHELPLGTGRFVLRMLGIDQ